MWGGASATKCRPALPSPDPESSSEQWAGLERQLRCLEQEKTELSRKLQGTGEPARPGLGVGSDPGATVGLAAHRWVPTPCPAEALQFSSDHRELERLRKQVQTLQGRLSGIPRPRPHAPDLFPASSPRRLSGVTGAPGSSPDSSPVPTLDTRCGLREIF